MARLEDEGIGVEDEFGCGLLDNLIEISGQIEYQNGESISFLFLKKKTKLQFQLYVFSSLLSPF